MNLTLIIALENLLVQMDRDSKDARLTSGKREVISQYMKKLGGIINHFFHEKTA